MKYHLSHLSNGLPLLTIPMTSLESVTVTVWVATGSRREDKRINGISHFLEHMTFKGSSKRPTSKDIAEAVDSFGGEFNAGTSKEWTNFYIKARSANLNVALDVLSDMVLKPVLSPTDIEREKGVIIEEIAMYEDMPMWRVGELFESLMFEGNPLNWDVAGTPKSVKVIRRADFEKYRKLFYHPKNMLLTVAGNVDEKKMMTLAEKYFAELGKSNKNGQVKNFVPGQKKPQVLLYPKKIEQAHFVLGFVGTAMGSKTRFAEAILTTILGNGMSSRLFTEVREKRGLAYSVRAEVEHFVDTGYISAYAGVDIKKAEEAIKVTLDQFHGIADGTYPISDNELKKAKEYLKGHLALSLEDTLDVTRFFGEKLLLAGKIETPEDVFEEIDRLTSADIVKVAKQIFVPKGLNLAIIGPFKNKAKFEKLLK